MSPSDSDDEEFELDLEEEGEAEEVAVSVEAEDATEDGDEESITDTSTTTDDDDDDDEDNDNSNEIDNELETRLQQELQESLAMEVDAELEADANELDAALLAEDPSMTASTSTQTISTADTAERDSLGQGSELPPLPLPMLEDQQHTGFSASPGRSRSSSVHHGAGPASRGDSVSPPPALGIPSRRKKRSPSPVSKRHAAIAAPVGLSTFTTRIPRTYHVEAICALPHPVPTHALACSFDMAHLLTGSDDGYIRDYDIFSAVNSKTFLSAPQRHHAGVVEGLMKAGQLRFWWENPAFNQRRGFIGGQAMPPLGPLMENDAGPAPVYSLLMHSDALWALAGTDAGHINLFTVRHEPGKAMHVFTEHKSPVSAMSMDYGEKGFFSASWDGEAIQWDLNTGSVVRNFAAHNSQLTSIAVRPAYSGPYFDPTPTPVAYRRKETASSSKKANSQQLYQFTQDDINMGLGNDNDGNSLFGDDPQDEMEDTKPSVAAPTPRDAMSMDPGSQPTHGNTTQPGASAPAGEDDEIKSEGSVADSLFGDDGDESESNANTNTNPPPTPATIYQPPPPPPPSQNPYLSTLSVPGSVQSGSVTSQYVFPVAGQQQGQQPYYTTQTFSVQLNPQQQQQQQAVMQYQQPPPPVQAPPPPRTVAKVAAAPKPPPKNAPPLLDSSCYSSFSSDLLMTAFVDGQVVLWDRRASTPGQGVGRLWMSEKTPPWCLSACWSHDGGQIYAGRRNGTVDVWDVRLMGRNSMTGVPKLLKTLRNPASSGVVSCVVPFPDCRHIASASIDNIRLWNVAEAPGDDSSMAKPRGPAPFKIIPGHHGGYISQMLIDPGARFMVTASSNRGLHGESTRTVFVHDIKLAY